MYNYSDQGECTCLACGQSRQSVNYFEDPLVGFAYAVSIFNPAVNRSGHMDAYMGHTTWPSGRAIDRAQQTV